MMLESIPNSRFSKSRLALTAVVISAVIATGGCASQQGQPILDKKTIGGGLGAVAGVAIGSNIGKGSGRDAAMLAGGLIGYLIGSKLGADLDRADRIMEEAAVRQAVASGKTGQALAWENPDSGVRGTVTPLASFENTDGKVCREFQETITVPQAGAEDAFGEGNGLACQQEDGSWKIISG